MRKYLFVYYQTLTATTPEEKKKSRYDWIEWFDKLGQAMVDDGAPTKPGKLVSKSDTSAVLENPITGYSIIQADNMEKAVEMAKGCPGIPDGGQVAVYETLVMQ